MMQVLELCRNEDASITQIVNVVQKDPTLAAKLLKTASSIFYAPRSPVTSVDRAVCIIGINTTMCVALSFSLVSSICDTIEAGRGFDAHVFWRRAVATAACARNLGRKRGVAGAADLFVAGLLQDIGMLVLSGALGEEYDRLVAASGNDHELLLKVEAKHLGVDHTDVGAWLLQEWQLPERLLRGVQGSHQPELFERTGDAEFVRACASAGQLSNLWCGPDLKQTPNQLDFNLDLKSIGLSRIAFESFLAEVSVEIAQETSSLDIRLGQDDAAKLLERAREALVVLSMKADQRARAAELRAQTDPLTGLLNRQALNDALTDTFLRAKGQGSPLSAVFADIDHFKGINDTHGHLVGDKVIQTVAQILQQGVRQDDMVGRYGGEEFLLLLPGSPKAVAAAVAEGLRQTVQSKSGLGGPPVTISLGVATFTGDNFDDAAEFVRAADSTLYAAKNSGRNRVSIHES